MYEDRNLRLYAFAASDCKMNSAHSSYVSVPLKKALPVVVSAFRPSHPQGFSMTPYYFTPWFNFAVCLNCTHHM